MNGDNDLTLYSEFSEKPARRNSHNAYQRLYGESVQYFRSPNYIRLSELVFGKYSKYGFLSETVMSRDQEDSDLDQLITIYKFFGPTKRYLEHMEYSMAYASVFDGEVCERCGSAINALNRGQHYLCRDCEEEMKPSNPTFHLDFFTEVKNDVDWDV